jgi:hypothetical protein
MSTPEDFDLSQTSTLIPNTFHNDKFDVIFSNFPSIPDFKDFRYFTNYCQNITMPELIMDMIDVNFQGAKTRHPNIPMLNRQMSQLMITFRLSEDFKNYLLLVDYIRQMRMGTLTDAPEDQLISKFYINSIDINLLDNHKRKIAVVSYTKVYPVMISSINLSFGSSDEILFSTNWNFSEIIYHTQSINA